MEITPEQYEKIKDSLPLQRGNVRLTGICGQCGYLRDGRM
jgi:hypothetical protein